MWCIPPEQNAEFVCAMENVLEVYKRPYDPKRPVVCLSLLSGCEPAPPKQQPSPRDLATAPQPWDGEYVMRDEAGEIVQRSVWNDHKLVSAWEVSETWADYESRVGSTVKF